tara:strand:+ start:12553 stop:13203 length:651 start_codon:yes stop_codon:yes gene_type:complete
MRKERKYNYIYKTTCDVNGKYYIGMHSTDKLDDGYVGSGKRLKFSINYHGKDNHSVEILEYYDTRKELRKRECEIVNEQLLTEDLCMNLMVGGEGGRGFTAEQQRLNAEKSNARQRVLRETDPEWAEIRDKRISAARVREYADGKRNWVWRKDWTGLKHSEEAKQKMSESTKGTGTGKDNSQYGTYWVSKDGVSKKIKKGDFEIMTQQGWVRGIKK